MPEQTYDLRSLSHQWFERVWNQRDASAIDQLCQPHVVIREIETIPVRVPIEGRLAIRAKGGTHAVSPFLLVRVHTETREFAGRA